MGMEESYTEKSLVGKIDAVNDHQKVLVFMSPLAFFLAALEYRGPWTITWSFS